jgi:hypothetical protein
MQSEVKMYFTRKTKFAAGSHMADPPSFIVSFTVVSGKVFSLAF